MVKGFVEETASIADNTVRYTILTKSAGNERLQVISIGKQAMKDSVFIRRNQRVIIYGKRMENKLFVYRSWIDTNGRKIDESP